MPKVILYISMSLDGFIATKDDDISWLDSIDHGENDYGYKKFSSTIDKYIVGRKTYDVVMNLVGEFAQAKEYNCYIISRSKSGVENGVTFYNGDIASLIDRLKSEGGKHIYCDGGAEIVKELMKEDLIDEYIISVIPIILGDGKRLFKGGIPSQKIKLIASKAYSNGLVQLNYTRS